MGEVAAHRADGEGFLCRTEVDEGNGSFDFGLRPPLRMT